MAIANAGSVTVDFQATTAQFSRQLEKVNDNLESVKKKMEDFGRVAEEALKFLALDFAAEFVNSAARAADALGKTADKLGITTERLAAFQLAAEDAGVETDTLSRLLTDAQKRLGDAAFGTGEARAQIIGFGFSIRDLQKLSPDQLFLKYADAINSLTNRSDQFAAANALFGKSAQEAFTLISAGSAGIQKATDSVERLGLALNRVDTFKIEAANDALGLLSKTSEAFGQHVAAAFAPFVEDIANRLSTVSGEANKAQASLQSFAQNTFVAFELASNAVQVFDIAVSSVAVTFSKVIELQSSGLAKLLDITAKLDTAVGLAKFGNFFAEQAAAERGVADFANAAADEATTRIRTAADSIKSFEQIFVEAQQIFQQAQQQAETAAAAQDAINANLRTPADRTQQLTASFNIEEGLAQQHFDIMLQIQKEFAEASAKLATQTDVNAFVQNQRFREDTLRQSEARMLQVRQLAANAGIGLLQQLAQHSKAAAIALIIVEKGQAIAQALIAGQVASVKAFAAYGPTPAGYAAAAAMQAYTAFTIGAIAATGFLEAQSVTSSSSGPSFSTSSSNPVYSDSGGSGVGGQVYGGPDRAQVNVIVEGVITPGAAVAIADALKDVIDNSDIRIIGKNSAQADDIRRGN